MKHQHDMWTLYNEYGLEYTGYFRHVNKRGFDTGKLCARFKKGSRVIWRIIYKGQAGDFVKYGGRVFYFN